MNQYTSANITQLLVQYQNGQPHDLQNILWAAYNDLARMGHHMMGGERHNHTLQTRALVHEAYLRMVELRHVHWQNRQHFFATWSGIMRRVLVDYARARNAGKRALNAASVSLPEDVLSAEDDSEILALHDALASLARLDPTQSKIVELRYFSGLSVEEVADVLEMSPATVKRKWVLAKAWLYRELSHQEYDS